MAVGDIIGNFTDGSLTATDDKSGTPNSATCERMVGDLKIEGLIPSGRTVTAYQGQGALRTLRKGERVFPTLSFTAQMAELMPAFQELIHGKTSGFVSVTADIGDAVGVDLSWSATYGASTRVATFQDAVLTKWDLAEGDPNTLACQFTCYGPVVVGGETIIATR